MKPYMPPDEMDVRLSSLNNESLRRVLGYVLWEMEKMKAEMEEMRVAADKAERKVRDVDARTRGFERY